MARRIIQILLGLAIIAVAYLLYNSISEPVKWKKEKELRYTAIKQRLLEIRDAQAAYKVANKHYAPTFAELTYFLMHGKGDTTPADSLFGKGYNAARMRYVPYNTDTTFFIKIFVSPSDGLEYIQVTDPVPFDPDEPLSIGSLVEPTLRASWEKTK